VQGYLKLTLTVHGLSEALLAQVDVPKDLVQASALARIARAFSTGGLQHISEIAHGR
jgi:hypothetical protein